MFIHVFMFGTEINELIRNWLEEIFSKFMKLSKLFQRTTSKPSLGNQIQFFEL